MSTFKKIIKEYLEKRAKGDAIFAEKFIERCRKDAKAIEGCCAYINSQARKEAQNGCAVIKDDKVFGWAMHYFDENIQAPKDAPAARVEVTPQENEPKKVVSAPVARPKARKEDDAQLSLW